MAHEQNQTCFNTFGQERSWSLETYEKNAGYQKKRVECFMVPGMGWQWRIYYDLFDADGNEPAETFFPQDGGASVTVVDFDNIDGNGDSDDPADHLLMDMLLNYMGDEEFTNDAYEDRGMERLDLVDTLDGMLCRGIMTEVDAAELLETVMGYDYDFSGPVVCP